MRELLLFVFVVAFTGGTSALDECLSSPCQNGGTCLDGDYGFYTCLCPENYNGFNCELVFLTTGCGRTFTEPTGIITSPNYPGNYTSRQICVYFIRVHGATEISLTITNFKLEEEKDILRIEEGYVAVDSFVGALTGDLTASLPMTTIYQSGGVWIFFATDRNIEDRGFRIEYGAGKFTYLIASESTDHCTVLMYVKVR